MLFMAKRKTFVKPLVHIKQIIEVYPIKQIAFELLLTFRNHSNMISRWLVARTQSLNCQRIMRIYHFLICLRYTYVSQYNHCSQLSHILAKISLSAFTPSPSLLQSVVLFICSNNRSTTVTDNCCEQLMRNRDYGTLDKPTDALYPPEML